MCDVSYHRPSWNNYFPKQKCQPSESNVPKRNADNQTAPDDNTCVDKSFIFRSVCYPQRLLSVFHSDVCVHRGYLDIPVVDESPLLSTGEIIRNTSAWVPQNDPILRWPKGLPSRVFTWSSSTLVSPYCGCLLLLLLLSLLLLRDNGVEIFNTRAAKVSPRTGQYCRRAF